MGSVMGASPYDLYSWTPEGGHRMPSLGRSLCDLWTVQHLAGLSIWGWDRLVRSTGFGVVLTWDGNVYLLLTSSL